MKRLSLSFMTALAASMLTPLFVHAQCGTDSSQTLTGKFTFALTTGPVRAAGQFTVLPGAPGTGQAFLLVNATVNSATSLTVADNGSGKLIYNANCTGGVGWLYGSYEAISFDFEFLNDSTFGRIIIMRNPQFRAFTTGSDYDRPAQPTTPGVIPSGCLVLANSTIQCFPYPWPADAPAGTPATLTQANTQWGTAWRAPAGCPATPSSLFSGVFASPGLTGTNRLTGTATSTTGGTFVATIAAPGTPFNPPGFTPIPVPAVPTVPGTFEAASDCAANCILMYSIPQAYSYYVYPRVALNGTVSFVFMGATLNVFPPTLNFAITQGTMSR